MDDCNHSSANHAEAECYVPVFAAGAALVVGALCAMNHEFGQKCIVLGLASLMLSAVLVGVGAFESGSSKMTSGST